MSLELDSQEIANVLRSYKKKRDRERRIYHQVIKHNDVLMERRREIAREHYWKNKEKKKEYYEKNKEHIRLQRLASYYKDNLETLKDKYPLDYEVMVDLELLAI